MASTCFPDEETLEELKLSEDEVVTLFMNMIAFNGDWDAHLDFLQNLEEERSWKNDQIFMVHELRNLDRLQDIQETVASV